MMSVAVFITSDDARIFKFLASGVESVHLHAHGVKHAPESLGRNHPQQGGDADRFFHSVAEEMSKLPADRWLVLGPGLAKKHFQHHVEQHHAANAKKIVGVESMDKATDGEIKNFAHDFFKKLGVFQ